MEDAMHADRYLKFILTVIAIELLWLGLNEAAPRVTAQQKPEATPVVITGVRIGGQEYTTIPVALTGSMRPNSIGGHRELPNLQPASIRVSDPIQIDTRQPLTVAQPVTVQTGTKPLAVDAIFKTGPAPGRP
jgi:hypothetical protein